MCLLDVCRFDIAILYRNPLMIFSDLPEVKAASNCLGLRDVIVQDCLDLINASKQRHSIALGCGKFQGLPVHLDSNIALHA